MGAAVRHPGRAPVRQRGGGCPWRRRAARRIHPRPGHPAGRRRAIGSGSPARTVAGSRPCWQCCSADCNRRQGRRRWAPSVAGRRGRSGPRSAGRPVHPAAHLRRAGARTGRNRRCGPCWPSSGCVASMCCDPPCRCHRGSGPGRRWRCCRPAGSICWCWTSRPTTWTCRRSSNSSRRLTGYTGTLLLVTHDRRMLEQVHLTRQWRVENGAVREL